MVYNEVSVCILGTLILFLQNTSWTEWQVTRKRINPKHHHTANSEAVGYRRPHKGLRLEVWGCGRQAWDWKTAVLLSSISQLRQWFCRKLQMQPQMCMICFIMTLTSTPVYLLNKLKAKKNLNKKTCQMNSCVLYVKTRNRAMFFTHCTSLKTYTDR